MEKKVDIASLYPSSMVVKNNIQLYPNRATRRKIAKQLKRRKK